MANSPKQMDSQIPIKGTPQTMVKQAAMAAALRKKAKQPKPDPSALGSG